MVKKIALLNRFKVYGEIAAGLVGCGFSVVPYVTAEDLRVILAQGDCSSVLDINFHPDIWEECLTAGADYTIWSFDSAVSRVMEMIDCSRLRPSDRFFLFNEEDCRRAAQYHDHVCYLPFSAGPGFELSPRRHDFRYDVAFVMNSYNTTRREAEQDYQDRLAAAGATERKLLALTHELGEAVVARHLNICDDNCLEQFWQELTMQCGMDPFHGDPVQRRRFCRGLGQVLSAAQREVCLRALGDAGFNVAVFGDNYWRGIAGEYDNVVYHGGADYDSLPLIYNQSKININLTQVQNLDSVPQRIFHLLASGGFALTNGAPALTRLFSPDTQVRLFADPSGMVQQTAYYLAHDRERIKIAERGHEEFLRGHRMVDRLGVIFGQTPEK